MVLAFFFPPDLRLTTEPKSRGSVQQVQGHPAPLAVGEHRVQGRL